MRQPARKLAPRQQVTQVEDPEFGTLLELPDIAIEGDPDANVLPFSEEEARDIPMRGHNPNRRRRPVTEIEPIDIQGSRSADVAPFDMEAWPKFADEPAFIPGAQTPARRADGVSTMLPEWVPSWATEVTGQPVRGMGGRVEWEFSPLIAELVADSEGEMPQDSFDVSTALMANLIPGYLPYRMMTGAEPTPESRTVSPDAAALGVAEGGSMGLVDEILGAFGGDAEGYRQERAATQRQNPGSFAMGDAAGGTALGLATGSASAGRGATPLARGALAALEGGTYGAVEGMARSNAPTFMGRAEDAIPGVVGGAVLGGGLGAQSRRMEQRAAQPVDEAAVSRAMSDANIEWASHAGAAQSRKRMRQLLGGDAERQIENADFLGQRMREIGVTAPRARGMLPPTGEQMGERFAAARANARTGIDSTRAAMEERGPVDVEPMLAPLRERLALLERTPGASTAAGQLRQRINEFESLGEPIYDDAGEMVGRADPILPFSELQRLKNYLFTSTGTDMNVEGERQGVYRSLRDLMQRTVDDADPAMGAAYRENRRTAEAGRRMAAMRADKDLQEAVNRRTSPSDYAMMAMGLGGGALPALVGDAATAGSVGLPAVAGAVVAGVANRAWRANEHGLAAMRLERTARRLREAPQRFGRYAGMLRAAQERGPQAFAAALYIAQQNDAAVREAMAEEEDVQGMRERATEAVPTMDQAIEEDINSIPTMDDL